MITQLPSPKDPKRVDRLIELIRAMAATGLGYEDIAFKLKIPRSYVRPFVIPGEK